MATFVQATTGFNGSGSNQNLFTSNFGASVTVGNRIIAVCCVDAANANLASIIDTAGNAYSFLSSYTASTLTILAYTAYVKTGGTIAVQATDAFLDGEIFAQEWSGMAYSDPLDTSTTATGTSAATTSGSLYTAINSNLVVFHAIMLQSQTNTYGAGTGWSNMSNTASSFTSGALESQTTSAVGATVTGSYTMTNTGVSSIGLTFGVLSDSSSGGHDSEGIYGQTIDVGQGLSSVGSIH